MDGTVLTVMSATANSAGNAPGVKDRNATYNNECIWHWRRMVEYLNGTAKPLQTSDVVKGKKRSRVGERTEAEIVADPLATAEELRALSNDSPSEVLYHPNCPQKLWWRLASEYPIEAPQTPAGALFLLEEPGRWTELELAYANDWLNGGRGVQSLPEPARRLFCCDCAEHVLPLFESRQINLSGPRKAIAIARRYAQGDTSISMMAKMNVITEQAERQATHARPAVFIPGSDLVSNNLSHAANRAGMSTVAVSRASGFSWVGVLSNAADAAYYASAAEAARLSPQYRQLVGGRSEEQVWQWHTLQKYLPKAKP